MMKPKNILTTFTVLFILALAMSVLGILKENEMLVLIFKPLTVASVLLLYLFYMKSESRRLYVIYLSLIVITDVIYYLGNSFFTVATYLYAICFSILIYICFSFKTIVNIRQFVSFSLFFIIPGFVVYYYVLQKQGASQISTFCFIIALCLLGVVSLINYLKKMSKENFLLMSGCLLMIFSDAIISLNAFHQSTQVVVNTIFTILIGITHYLITTSFIVRDTKRDVIKTQ